MGHSEYDAAWVARVKDPATGTPLFPEVLDVVRRTQADDGGWAADVEYPSARLLATLSSILAITDYDATSSDDSAAQRGADFVLRMFRQFDASHELTIGFELVVPTLIQEACERGFELQGLLPIALDWREQKLRLMPENMAYDPGASISFSLEFLGRAIDTERARRLLLSDGSIGASVAATAYYAARTGERRSIEFLREVVQVCGPENIPYGYPVKLWPTLWVLHHLRMAGVELAVEQTEPLLEYIGASFNDEGLTWCEKLTYADSDCTAMALGLLGPSASLQQWRTLDKFESASGFKCFIGERSSSMSVNAHVLTALQGGRHPDASRMAKKAAAFLLESRRPDGSWADKWHVSPLYPTSRSVMALLTCGAKDRLDPTIQWLLETQRVDGSWGYYGFGTGEETAYAVHALVSYYGIEPRPRVAEALMRAYRFLGPYDGTEPRSIHPKMWITKVLYRPLAVVTSAILVARIMAERALGLTGMVPK
jgi:halimadienyl-diphosphate synthase